MKQDGNAAGEQQQGTKHLLQLPSLCSLA